MAIYERIYDHIFPYMALKLEPVECVQVWSCGDQSSGQCGLGVGSSKFVNTFCAIDCLSAVQSISCGFKHSSALSSGKMYRRARGTIQVGHTSGKPFVCLHCIGWSKVYLALFQKISMMRS